LKNRVYILFFILLAILPVSLSAKADTLAIKYDSSEIIPMTFDQNHLQDYKSDKAFDYKEKVIKNTFWTKIKQWLYDIFLRIFKWIFGHEKAVSYLSKFNEIIPYIGLAALLFFVIRFLFRANLIKYFGGNDADAEVNYDEDEDIIRKKNIDNLIKEAIEIEDYRLALRYYFLKLLKKLENNGIIKWESQKTNFDYLNEIKQKEQHSKFKRFTLWYDYIWYGKYPLNHIEFNEMSKEFNSFFNKLTK